MMRYVRAFFTALRITLAGDAPQPTPLEHWITDAQRQLDALTKLADQHNIEPQQVMAEIDRRTMSMATIVDIVRFHLTEEYPIMLRHQTSDSLNYIYATNLDDHFRLTRLEAALSTTPLQAAITRLSDHLEAIPRPEDK